MDGTSTFSPVRTVRFAASDQGTLSLYLYPNPSPGPVTLDLSGLPTGSYAVKVFDLAGRLLRTAPASAQPLPLSLADLPQGAYLVLVEGENFRRTLLLLRN